MLLIWCVDPIDGTRDYIRGLVRFGGFYCGWQACVCNNGSASRKTAMGGGGSGGSGGFGQGVAECVSISGVDTQDLSKLPLPPFPFAGKAQFRYRF